MKYMEPNLPQQLVNISLLGKCRPHNFICYHKEVFLRTYDINVGDTRHLNTRGVVKFREQRRDAYRQTKGYMVKGKQLFRIALFPKLSCTPCK